MYKGFLIWFTGVPASGKSTIATGVEEELKKRGIPVENLDSDEIRKNLSPDLGYTPADRDMNTKRLAFLGKMLSRNGVGVLVAAVSSKRSFRDRAREWVPNFVEVFVECSLKECKKRDPKGLYAKGERGEIDDIAGWHQPYEEPENAELVLDTVTTSLEDEVAAVMAKLEEFGYIPKQDEGENVYSKEEEDKIVDRLEKLGYI